MLSRLQLHPIALSSALPRVAANPQSIIWQLKRDHSCAMPIETLQNECRGFLRSAIPTTTPGRNNSWKMFETGSYVLQRWVLWPKRSREPRQATATLNNNNGDSTPNAFGKLVGYSVLQIPLPNWWWVKMLIPLSILQSLGIHHVRGYISWPR